MDDDDYDSDELEFEIPQNPFASAGLESIEAIVNNAAEDRRSSKKMTKQLTFVEASKKTEYLSYLWYNRFVAFRANSLRKSPVDTPSMDELERFLCSIVSRVRPRSNEVPAFSWLRGGLRRLIVITTFHFADFRVSKHDSIRMKTMFQQLLNEGRITKEPSRKVQWLGTILVRRLITVIFQEAINEGTRNWDKTIMKALSLLLISALSCRSGDIMTSTRDTQDIPFLCYSDITIKLVDGDKLENLQADILIRNEKKKKHDPKKNRTVRLHCLTDPQDGILCPIKVVIALAMRLGAITCRTIEEVLEATRQRQDKTVQWADGKGHDPILCAFHNQSNAVIVTKAAEIRQAINTIHEVSLKAGLCALVTPHDMRRGAAKDAAHSKKAATGLATAVVAAELGQSVQSLNGGITAAYVGTRNEDTWERRVHAGFNDPFGINITNTVYKRQKMTKDEMSKLYADLGIDASNSNERRKARRKHEAAREKTWRDNQGGQRQPLRAQTQSQMNQGAPNAPQPLETGSACSADAPQPLRTGNADSVAENIGALIGNIDGAEANEMTAQSLVFSQMEELIQLPQELCVPGTEFVDYLAHINLIRHGVSTKKEEDRILGKYTGNSRNEPTAFEYKCPGYKECGYKSAWLRKVVRHKVRCGRV